MDFQEMTEANLAKYPTLAVWVSKVEKAAEMGRIRRMFWILKSAYWLRAHKNELFREAASWEKENETQKAR